MTTIDRVKKVATRAGAVAKTGELRRIDSVIMVDLVVGLEKEFALAIPPAELKPERFTSLITLAELVDVLQAAKLQAQQANKPQTS